MSADDRSRNLVRRKMMQSAVRGSVQRAKQAATEPDTDTTDYGEQTIQNRAETSGWHSRKRSRKHCQNQL